MKILTTKRKFYGKWAYKTSVLVPGCSKLRTISLEDILVHSQQHGDDLIKFTNFIIDLPKSEYATRIEGKYIDFYSNDKNLFSKSVEYFGDSVKTISVPESGTENMLLDGKTVVCHKLPHDRYRYKVYLQPHKFNSVEDKSRYLSWIDTQFPRVSISQTVKNWFLTTSWNWDRRYIWVEDANTLLLLKMRNIEAMGSIYNYVIADK